MTDVTLRGNALAVLAQSRDVNGGDDRLAIRAAALDAAIRHVAGDGCKLADNKGTGAMIVDVARTFEGYLDGDEDTPQADAADESPGLRIAEPDPPRRQWVITPGRAERLAGIATRASSLLVDDSMIQTSLRELAALLRGEQPPNPEAGGR